MNRESKGDGKFTAILIILLLQTALLSLVILNQYGVFSPAVKKSEPSPFAEYPPEEQKQPPAVISPEEEVTAAEVPSPVKIEILNGCGEKGIANKAADYLRKKGYDVRDFRNASKTYKYTTLIARVNDKTKAEKLAADIELPLEMVKIELDTSLVDIDVSLIIGKDHKRYVLPQ